MRKVGKLIIISSLAVIMGLAGLVYIQYGDARSYPFDIANYQNEYDISSGSYATQSGLGQISSPVILASRSNGNPVVMNFNGMDDSLSTPSGNNSGTFTDSPPPNSNGISGTVANNNPNAWDVSRPSMKSFPAGDARGFLFNNNRASGNQSLAAGARMWGTDASNSIVGNSPYPTSNGDGGIFTGDAVSDTGSGTDPLHEEVGQTDFSPDGLFGSPSDTEHVDIRSGCELDRGPSFACGPGNGRGTELNGDLESVVVGKGVPSVPLGGSNEIPEPGTLALLGAILLGVISRRYYSA